MMQKRSHCLALAVVLFTSVFFIGLPIVGHCEDVRVVKLGLVGSWTGPLGIMGQVTKPGALLAAKHINEEGGFVVNGQRYKLEFVDWDDRTDPKVTVAGVQSLMDEHNIKVFLGPMLSASTLAAQPLTQPKKVILVVYSSADQILRPGIDYTFRVAPSSSQLSQPAIRYYVEHVGVKNVAYLTENTATALSNEEKSRALFEELGAKVLARETYETGTTDFFSYIAKLKAKNPDALFIPTPLPESAALIIRQTRELGWKVLTLSNSGQSTGEFWEVGGPAIEGHLDVGGINKTDPGPELVEVMGYDLEKRKKFAQAMKEEYPKIDVWSSKCGMYYDNTYMVVEAMKAAGSVEDTDKIREALLKTDYRGVLQQYNFLPSGQAKYMITVIRVHEVGWDPVAMGRPMDEELKVWEIKTIGQVKTIDEIRKENGY